MRWARALPSARRRACSLSSFIEGYGSFTMGAAAGFVQSVQLIPTIPTTHTSLNTVTGQFLPFASTSLSLTFIIAMEALSPNLLSLILPAVGCIEEVVRLREVCRRWREVLQTVPLVVNFEYAETVGMQSWYLARKLPLKGSEMGFKLLWTLNIAVLNLRHQTVSAPLLQLAFQHCSIRKLDLSYTDAHSEYQRFLANVLSREEIKRNCAALEELRLSGMTDLDLFTAQKTAELFPNLRTLYVNNVPSDFPATAFFTQ